MDNDVVRVMMVVMMVMVVVVAVMMVCSSPGWVLAAIQVSGARAAAMSGGSGVSGGVWYLRLGVMVMLVAGTPSWRKRRASWRVCAFTCRWASGSRSRRRA